MFVWLLQNTILAGLLAIGVALLCRFRRIGPALRHALWLLVLVRLVLPPGALNWPWEVPLRWPAPAAVTEEKSIAQRPAETSSIESVEIVQSLAGKVPEPPPPPPEPPVSTTVSAASVSWWIWAGRGALLFWFAGALAIAWRQCRGIVQLHFLARAGLPASARLQRWVGELAAKMNLRSPRVLVVPGLASPLVGGLFRPVLLWPQQLEDRLSENGLKAVLVHELAHLRRRDHWVRWLEVLAECVWWWNPLFRLARARVRQYAELACDAWVLAVLPQARRAYADALVEVCSRVSRGRQVVPALGIEGEGDFQRRLTMIMRETVACRLPRRTLLAIGALALLALPGFTLGQDKPKSNEPPNEKKEAPAASKPGIGVIWADFDGDGKVEIILQDELFDLIDSQPEDRDKKLAELEARVQAMLKEIQELKGKPAGQPETQKHIESALKYLRTIQAEKDWAKNYSSTARGLAALALAQGRKIESAPNSVTLLRVTYLLPPGKAPALANLLKDHAKATPLEAKVEGDKLVVTATPENQRVIHAVINLMQDPEKPK